KTRSTVYEQFDFDEDSDTFKCNHCQTKYKRPISGSNGAMVKHLRSKHPAYSDQAGKH
ncbi:unnamed protein product, partial [Allacma fusca]